MRGGRRWLAVATLLGVAGTLTAVAPRPAKADDDWSVTKDPFNLTIVNRYKALLFKNPEDGMALRKLLELYGKYRSVDLLLKEMTKKAGPAEPWQVDQIIGHIQRAQKNDAEALAAYQRAAAKAPAQWTIHHAIGELHRRRREWAEARAALDKALSGAKGDDRKQILRTLADLALDSKDIARARVLFDELIQLDPKNVQVRRDFAEALARHDLHKEALAEFQKAEALVRGDSATRAELMSRIGEEQAKTGDDDAAVKTWRDAMALTVKGHWLRKQLTEKIVEVYRKKEQLRSLVEAYEKEWSVGSRGFFEWDVLARLHEELGDQDKALAAYRAAAKAAPQELETRRRLIALLERAGHGDEALKEYEAVIKVAPGEPKFQLDLAERYWKLGKRKEALALAQAMRARFAGDPGVHAALADLFSRWGKPAEALKEYEALVRVEPEDEGHLVDLGEQHYQRGDKAKAIAIWKRLLAKKTAESLARLAEVYAEHGMEAEALEMFEKAIALKPKDAQLYRGLAGVFERMRREDDAVASWEKVLALAGTDAAGKPLRREARTRIIALLARSGKLASKMQAFRARFNVPTLNTDDLALEAGFFLAEANLKLSPPQPKEAIAVLVKMLKARPDEFDVLTSLASVYRQQRMLDEAIAILLKLAELNPSRRRELYLQIAELEQQRYRFDEAEKYANQALELSPNDAQAQEKLGKLYEDRSDYERAIAAYKRALEINDRAFKVGFALARLYLRKGGMEAEALALYRDVVKRSPDEEVVLDAAQRATDLAEYLGTLGELERDLAPLVFLYAQKAVYRKVLVRTIERQVPRLVARARAPGGDAEATAELARIGEHGLKPLLEALTDGDDNERRTAVSTLGYLGNKSAAPALVRFVMDSGKPRPEVPADSYVVLDAAPDMALRVEALVAAGRLGDERTVADLATLLTDKESAIKEAAAWALGMTRSSKAIAPLTKALTMDPRPQVRMYACVSLGALGDKKALPAVLAAARDAQRGADVQAACGFALGLLGDTSAPTLEVLGALLAEGNEQAQRKAAWALGKLGDRRVLPQLLRAYVSKRDQVREALAWAIARAAGARSAVPAWRSDVQVIGGKIDYRGFMNGLEGPLPVTPVTAGVLAGAAGDLATGVVDALGRHRDLVVRVLRDLDSRDDGLGLGPLTADLDALGSGQREAVLAVLADLGGKLGPALEPLLGHRDAEVRRLALSVGAKLGLPTVRDAIVRALGEKELAAQLAALAAAPRAARKLGTLTDRKVLVTAVAATLTGSRWQLRVAAAQTLGQLGDAGAEAPLVTALGDVSGFVREAAAEALGQLGGSPGGVGKLGPAALAALRKAAADTGEVPEVRAAATQALARVKTPG